jgi:hypothetical protein
VLDIGDEISILIHISANNSDYEQTLALKDKQKGRCLSRNNAEATKRRMAPVDAESSKQCAVTAAMASAIDVGAAREARPERRFNPDLVERFFSKCGYE